MATTACQQTGRVSVGLLAHLAWLPDTACALDSTAQDTMHTLQAGLVCSGRILCRLQLASKPELRGLAVTAWAGKELSSPPSAFTAGRPVRQAGAAAGPDLEAAAPQRRLGGVHGWEQHQDQQGHMQGGCLQALLAVQHLQPPRLKLGAMPRVT